MRLAAVLVISLLTSQALAQPSPRGTAASGQAERVARLLARGQALQAAGDTISALAFYRDAITAAPRRSEGYVALGELYQSLDEPLRALEVFEAGSRQTPGSEPLTLGLAATLKSLGQDERALDVLRRLRALAPSPRGLRVLAEAAEARGAFSEALAVRRALLDQLTRVDDPSTTAERAQVRALELLLGAAERVRARAVCGQPGVSVVQRALARCP